MNRFLCSVGAKPDTMGMFCTYGAKLLFYFYYKALSPNEDSIMLTIHINLPLFK
jgi:hypothetical protein